MSTSILPISTRGAGMAAANLYQMLSTCEYFFEAVPHICSYYRATLGFLELKLAIVQANYDSVLTNGGKEFQYVSEFPTDFNGIGNCPASLTRLINAIGYLKHETGTYVPAVHKRSYENGRYIPRTDNILLSNLRETVVALSDVNTPLIYRKSFFQNNPIPGARFENNLLLNPEEIIPEQFSITEECLGADMNQVVPLAQEVRLHFGLTSVIEADFESEGKECMLVTNNQCNLAIPSRRENQDLSTYYTQCAPSGDIKDYWSKKTLSPVAQIEGSLNLLGELPNINTFMTSTFYCERDIRRFENPAMINMSYKDICEEMYLPYDESRGSYGHPSNYER